MMAVLLAGGRGSRLHPYTMNIPKPLLPLGDIPVVEVVLRQLAQQGFDRAVLTVGHMAPLLSAFLGDGSRYGLRVDYQLEEEPLGTAGPLRGVVDLEEDFLVMNGDLLTTIDFADLVAGHRVAGATGTIALTRRTVAIDYGVVHRTPEGTLDRYEEKPTFDYRVSTGINVLSRSAIDLVPEGRFDMPDLMTALTAHGRTVRCVETDAYWQDIGRIEDYERASRDFVADPTRFLPAAAVA
jgi:NDP-sugar pyrophosphorylase family protein